MTEYKAIKNCNLGTTMTLQVENLSFFASYLSN